MFAALIWTLTLIILGAVGYAGYRLGARKAKAKNRDGNAP